MGQTRRSPGDDSRAPYEKAGRPTQRLAPPADTATHPRRADWIVTDPRHARRLALRHRLYRHPRHCKALDRLLYGAPDPWTYAEPVGDFYHDAQLDRPIATVTHG